MDGAAPLDDAAEVEGDGDDASGAGALESDVAAGELGEAPEGDCPGCADCVGVAPDEAGLTVPDAEGFEPAEASVGACGAEGVAPAPSVGVAEDDGAGDAAELDGCAFLEDEPVQSASVFKCPGR